MKTFKQLLTESVSTTSKKEIAKKADMGFAGYINDLKNEFGFVGIASDLVSCDEQFKTIKSNHHQSR